MSRRIRGGNSRPYGGPNLSARVKTCVLAYYRFQAGARLFCTELTVFEGFRRGGTVLDVAVIDRDGRFVEVEVKVSLSDLKRDFEKPKHGANGYRGGKGRFVTDRFLFAVPDTMDIDKVLSLMDTLDPQGNYGVLAVTLPEPCAGEPLWFLDSGSGEVRVVRPPKSLGAREPDPKLLWSIERRLMAELVNQRYMAESFLPFKVGQAT
ncbi:MAG: hypothetical protein LBR80_07700 [Deltaproteobacteria bacterium]|jgi:hypothetical protein|nr:hypothetical protein [Deltaproteobacteria bacterium]